MLQCVYQMKDWARKPIMTCEFCVHKLPVWQSSLWQRPFWCEECRAQNVVLSAAFLYVDKIKEPRRLLAWKLFYWCELVVDTLFLVVDIASSLMAAWLYDTFRNYIIPFFLSTGKKTCGIDRLVTHTNCD